AHRRGRRLVRAPRRRPADRDARLHAPVPGERARDRAAMDLAQSAGLGDLRHDRAGGGARVPLVLLLFRRRAVGPGEHRHQSRAVPRRVRRPVRDRRDHRPVPDHRRGRLSPAGLPGRLRRVPRRSGRRADLVPVRPPRPGERPRAGVSARGAPGGGRASSREEEAMGPLAGLKVIDLTHVMAGPTCTLMLADMGADVIKVEKIPDGDDTRRAVPPTIDGEAAAFMMMNRNKRGIALDLKTPGGRRVLARLLADADVVVENYRPGTMARLGFDYEALRRDNPGLIYCALSGFGRTGPYGHRGGFDLVAQAMSEIGRASCRERG